MIANDDAHMHTKENEFEPIYLTTESQGGAADGMSKVSSRRVMIEMESSQVFIDLESNHRLVRALPVFIWRQEGITP